MVADLAPARAFSFDALELLRVAAFFAGSVLLVALAKYLRDLIALRRGHDLAKLIVHKDNTPVAVEMAGFVLAMTIALLGALFVQGDAWWQQALDLVGTGAIVMLVLLANDQLVSRVVLRGLDCNTAVMIDHNLAVAIVRAAGNVATAFALTAALNHPSPLWERLVWMVLGQGALVGLSFVYQWVTPYDDVAEVKRNNVAAALPMAGVLLAAGLVVRSALAGAGAGWGPDLLSLAIDLAVSGALVLALRWLGDKLILPGSTFEEEIARDRNAGVGFIEATLYVSGALAASYFLT